MPVFEKAVWRPVPAHSGNMSAHLGLILHVQVGSNSCFPEFNDVRNQASATWWISKSGTIEQYVDSDFIAWAEMSGNGTYDSCETEGLPSEALTDAQIQSFAEIYAWGHGGYGWPMQLAEKPGDRGLGWHGMGGQAWGNHLGCPGDLRKAQRPAILATATQLITVIPTPQEAINMLQLQHPCVAIVPTKTGKGYYLVASNGGVFSFGDAEFHGSMGAEQLNAPIVGAELTPTGAGYWLVGQDGGVFAFGDAEFCKTFDGKAGTDFIR